MSWQERFEKKFGKIAYTGGLKSEFKAFIQSELDTQVAEVRAEVTGVLAERIYKRDMDDIAKAIVMSEIAMYQGEHGILKGIPVAQLSNNGGGE